MASPIAPQRPAHKRKARPPSAGPAKRARGTAGASGDGSAFGLLLQAAELEPSPPGQAQVQAEAETSTAGACAAAGGAGAFQGSGSTEKQRRDASTRPGAALAAQEAVRQPAQQGVETRAADSAEARGAGPQATQDSQPSAFQVAGSGAGLGPAQASGRAGAQRLVGDRQTRRSPPPGEAETAGAAAAHWPAAPGVYAPGSGQGKPTGAAAAAEASSHVQLDGQARLFADRNSICAR